jgi:hypothetical protein
LLGIAFTVITACLSRLQLKGPRESTEDSAISRVYDRRSPGDIERHIASGVEAEIVRRTTLRRESGE